MADSRLQRINWLLEMLATNNQSRVFYRRGNIELCGLKIHKEAYNWCVLGHINLTRS